MSKKMWQSLLMLAVGSLLSWWLPRTYGVPPMPRPPAPMGAPAESRVYDVNGHEFENTAWPCVSTTGTVSGQVQYVISNNTLIPSSTSTAPPSLSVHVSSDRIYVCGMR